MAYDPVVASHKEWLGYVQPIGLVVSIPALMDAGAVINRNFAPMHRRLLDALPKDGKDIPVPEYASFPNFSQAVFDWPLHNLYGASGAPAVPESLECRLEGFEETLRPTYALREMEPKEGQEWILLVQEVPRGTDLDPTFHQDGKRWEASRKPASSTCCIGRAFPRDCWSTEPKSGWYTLREWSPAATPVSR